MAYDSDPSGRLSATSQATVASTKPVWSLQQIIDNYGRNNLTWQGRTITYTFMEARPNSEFRAFTEEERNFTRAAFDLIADVVNLTFVEAADNGSSFGRIAFGADGGAENFEWGHATWQSTWGFPRSQITGAEVWINPEAVATRQWFFGGYNFQALLHEAIHALGVLHPGNYNANGQSITYAEFASFMQDSRQYTVMSYFSGADTGADFGIETPSPTPGEPPTNNLYSPSTLMLHDVAGLQAIYGANLSTRSGDTVYGYNSTAGRASYDFATARAPIVCIWDGGGVDTLDLSGTATACNLDLNEGAFSDAFTMTKNISIAYGVVIENAVGGSADDTVVGNTAANILKGMNGDDVLNGQGGNDTLDGGAGVDTAVYAGGQDDYSWWMNRDGTWSIHDDRAGSVEGRDSLIAIETLRFSDGLVRLTGLTTRETLTQAFDNILRRSPAAGADAATVAALTADVEAGRLTLAQAVDKIVDLAADTTSVAVLAYQFFVGYAPGKQGLNYLVAPDGPNENNLNSAYYRTFNIENRYINFAVNLGRDGEGRAGFSAEYGSLSLFEATRKAYGEIFGVAADDAKVRALLEPMLDLGGVTMTRAQYFEVYGRDALGTKAAMVGWLLTEAEKADLGVYALSADAFLADLADGAQYRVDVLGVYGGGSQAEWPG